MLAGFINGETDTGSHNHMVFRRDSNCLLQYNLYSKTARNNLSSAIFNFPQRFSTCSQPFAVDAAELYISGGPAPADEKIRYFMQYKRALGPSGRSDRKIICALYIG
jgi:hypothetical protein